MAELWARVSTKISMNKEEIEAFKENPKEVFVELLDAGRITIVGDTYFPLTDENEIINGVGGEECEGEFEVDLDFIPIRRYQS